MQIKLSCLWQWIIVATLLWFAAIFAQGCGPDDSYIDLTSPVDHTDESTPVADDWYDDDGVDYDCDHTYTLEELGL